MKPTTFVDLLLYLKNQARLIAAVALAGALLAVALGQATQSYTATVAIQYAHPDAQQGLDPLGGALNPYEIMSPALIESALSRMKSGVSVDEVRNKLAITPLYKDSAQEAATAKLALGEEVQISTVDYSVAYTCDGKLGSQFAKRLLHNLLRAYDDSYRLTYLQVQRVPDFMGAVDVRQMDYMELCEYIDAQLAAISSTLDQLVEADSAFTSVLTGLDFAALRYYYNSLRDNEFRRLYADVRMGLLSKNPQLLVQGYEKRIEDMKLQSANSAAESQLSHEMVRKFYEQYKENNLYYQARASQLELDDNKGDNKNLVYDYDLSLMMNTYDEILLRYVNSGVAAANLARDSAHYEKLAQAFLAGAQAGPAAARAEELIAQIAQCSARYAELANQTLGDYYAAQGAQLLKYVMGVEVVANVSLPLYALLGLGIALFMGCALAVVLEAIKEQLRARRAEALNADAPGGVTPEVVAQMSAMERAFYEQSQEGFSEFYLLYQPIVDAQNRWAMAESLVRWDSKRMGQVLPSEFIPIAEKYQLMGALGEWVMKKASAQSMAWGHAVSINYSVGQIQDEAFVGGICRLLTETKADPSRIYLEISGGGELRDIDQFNKMATALKALGLHLTLDRFGDSMSSLRALYDLPVDLVKVDKKLIGGLRAEGGGAFLRDVIGVCKERGLPLCLAGVEEPWQAAAARELGVEFLQGFYFAGALSAEDYERKRALGAKGAEKA